MVEKNIIEAMDKIYYEAIRMIVLYRLPAIKEAGIRLSAHRDFARKLF
jgi:hypothetical protein